jgi:hypothetical protein
MGELEPLAGTVGCSLLVGLRMPPLYREVFSRMAASEGHCGPLAKAPAGTSMRVPHGPLSLLKGVTRPGAPCQGSLRLIMPVTVARGQAAKGPSG